MRRWIPFVAAALLVATAACGGGGKTVTVPGGKVSVGGSLPSSFPKDFPTYPGAKYVGGLESTQRGVSGFYATWETSDSADKVLSYYKDAFKNSAWTTTTTVDSSGGSFIGVERKDDATQTGFVSVTGSGGKTTIGVLVGKNLNGTSSGATPSSASGGGGSTPSAKDTPAPAAKLPQGYPSDRAPLPSGAHITSASTISSGGQQIFTLEFDSADSEQSVADYFKSELPKHGWTSALATESNGQFFLSWGGAGNESVSVSIDKSDVSGYTSKVVMLVTVKGS
ncbi:MAG: hypothetical protein ACYDEB_09545 [Dehalococcoidia bacterium]